MAMENEKQQNFRIRPAIFADTNAIADVLLQQVTHDGFHDFFFPRQDEYPDDFRDWWRRYCRRHVLRPYLMTLVGEDETGNIVGMAMWAFQPRCLLSPGEGPKPQELDLAKDTLTEKIQRQYIRIADALHDKVYPNRAVSEEAMAELPGVMSALEEKLWKGEDRVSWYCFEIAVDRSWDGAQKLWDELMQWGPERAQVDHVAVFAGAGTRDELDGMARLGYKQVADLTFSHAHGWILKREADSILEKEST